MPDAVVLLRGNRNAAKHFVHARFATNESMVIGGRTMERFGFVKWEREW
jgi:hypothetical protein